MISGKFLSNLSRLPTIYPYISWEVGAAFNVASTFAETPLTDITPGFPFLDNSRTTFTYGVGAGFEYQWSEQIRLGVGYQFADLGSVPLGLSLTADGIQSLNMPHLYTNQVRFQFTYLI